MNLAACATLGVDKSADQETSVNRSFELDARVISSGLKAPHRRCPESGAEHHIESLADADIFDLRREAEAVEW